MCGLAAMGAMCPTRCNRRSSSFTSSITTTSTSASFSSSSFPSSQPSSLTCDSLNIASKEILGDPKVVVYETRNDVLPVLHVPTTTADVNVIYRLVSYHIPSTTCRHCVHAPPLRSCSATAFMLRHCVLLRSELSAWFFRCDPSALMMTL